MVFVGLVFVFYGVIHMPQAVMKIKWYSDMVYADGSRPDMTYVWLTQAAYPVVFLGVGLLLLLRGEVVAGRLIRDDRKIDCVTPREWERSIFSVGIISIGVFWLVSYIPYVFSCVLAATWQRARVAAYTVGWGDLLGGVLVLVVGIYLITGAKHLVRVLYGSADANMDPIDQGET